LWVRMNEENPRLKNSQGIGGAPANRIAIHGARNELINNPFTDGPWGVRKSLRGDGIFECQVQGELLNQAQWVVYPAVYGRAPTIVSLQHYFINSLWLRAGITHLFFLCRIGKISP
jgi:hypothetical protein